MPRGQRKSLEEKIQAKQELINALNIRIESEERELEELYEQKSQKQKMQLWKKKLLIRQMIKQKIQI